MLPYLGNFAIAFVLLVTSTFCFAQEPAKQNVLNYPHAGISLSVPEDFKPQLLEHPKELARFVKFSNKTPISALILSAYLVSPEDTLESISAVMQEMTSKSLAVRDFKILKKTDISVAGITGQATLASYNFRGRPTVSAQTFFIRDLKNLGLKICYIINVETPQKDTQKLLPLLGKIISSVKLTAVQRPADIPIELSENKLKNFKKGISLKVPQSWYASESDMGITLGITDYLYGGVSVPNVDIVAVELPGKVQSETCVDKAMAAFVNEAKQKNNATKLIFRKDSTINGQPASSFLLQIQPAKQTSTAPSADVGILRGVTSICVYNEQAKKTKSYAIILTAIPNDTKAAEKWINAIVSGFEIINNSK